MILWLLLILLNHIFFILNIRLITINHLVNHLHFIDKFSFVFGFIVNLKLLFGVRLLRERFCGNLFTFLLYLNLSFLLTTSFSTTILHQALYFSLPLMCKSRKFHAILIILLIHCKVIFNIQNVLSNIVSTLVRVKLVLTMIFLLTLPT